MTPPDMETRIAESKAFVHTFHVEPKGSGILDGLRFAVKDLIDQEGYKTSCGNPRWRDTHPVAPANAVCVDQLLYSGAVCVGKTVLDELAFGLSGENFFYGTSLNPKALDRVPGGSSSGSASAVACGVVDFALGTDTGGSVRVPASNCGIFGMRPSHGAISVAGVNPLAPSFDTVGVFAGTSEVLSRVISVLIGCDIPSEVSIGHVHFLQEPFAQCDPEVNNALQVPVDAIRQAFEGRSSETSLTSITAGSPSDLHDWYITYCEIQWAEIWSCLGPWVAETNPEFGPTTRRNFEHVRNLDRGISVKAVRRREFYYRALKKFIGPSDLICLPTTPTLAPLKGTLGVDRTVEDYYPRTLSFTSIAGIGRLPQVTLPLGNSNDIPMGLSLLASEGNDAFLLGAAQTIMKLNNP
ncbi:MAG: amidase [Desulfomonile sp.]|nr:amidase [Desulfomonile sp.]